MLYNHSHPSEHQKASLVPMISFIDQLGTAQHDAKFNDNTGQNVLNNLESLGTIRSPVLGLAQVL